MQETGRDTLKENFAKIVDAARADHAKVEVLVSGGENLSLGYSQRKLEKFQSTQSQMAGVRVVLGSSQGYAYTENLEAEALLRTYREALANAKTVSSSTETAEIPMVSAEGAVSGIRESSSPAAGSGANFFAMASLFKPEDVPMAEKMKVAEKLESLCLEADARVQNVPYSSFNEGTSFRRILNSEGLDKEFRQSYYSGFAYALAKEGASSKMDGESFFARSFADIHVEEVVAKSVKKAVSRLGAEKLKTGNYPVVIGREAFSTILSMFVGYLSAKEVHEQKSLFDGKLGEAVASAKFSMVDDPFEMSCSGVRPFDSEGAPSQRTVLFEKGVLKHFLTNAEYAKKMNLPHTAHAARSPTSAMGIGSTNLIIEKGSESLVQLLKRSPKMIHLTNFSGGLHAGFKESTGDFSMPAEGFLYEDGVCVGPVDQFVVSGNVLTLLKDVEDVSSEYSKPGTSVLSPDVLIKALSFAGA